ncbi:hypothetical protein OEZ60_11775 [Defluviimonas sp. WL0024]|uniref:Uncharacterized protein n=1 Tax=Albidovulum salinarum TaxID=2984153 RepID=A0ABT2X410_9RHOB|nr:hypothetical protein [Defluviimonas sp. WL0024]MCU9848683.1 hypothetical protein [Defluviimonas sp. WL0024]
MSSWLDGILNPLEAVLADAMGGTFDRPSFLKWVRDAAGAQENLWRVSRETERPAATRAVARSPGVVTLDTALLRGSGRRRRFP